MSATVLGRSSWSAKRDNMGHRTYTLKQKVLTTSFDDGPAQVMVAAGSPTIGSYWNQGGDVDFWAYCSPECEVEPYEAKDEKHKTWILTNNFTTLPFKRCADQSIQDPMNEPPIISGSFTRFQAPVRKDRNGKVIKYVTFEPIKGLVKDFNRPSVVISINSLDLGLSTFAQFINGVNDSPLWGVGARCVMLVNVSWARKIYGTCGYYYTKTFEFEVRYDGFDIKDVPQMGYKVRRGKWVKTAGQYVWTPSSADPTKPDSFAVFKDYAGRSTPTPVFLNATGDPVDPSTPVYVPPIEIADQFNMYALGVPAYLG